MNKTLPHFFPVHFCISLLSPCLSLPLLCWGVCGGGRGGERGGEAAGAQPRGADLRDRHVAGRHAQRGGQGRLDEKVWLHIPGRQMKCLPKNLTRRLTADPVHATRQRQIINFFKYFPVHWGSLKFEPWLILAEVYFTSTKPVSDTKTIEIRTS